MSPQKPSAGRVLLLDNYDSFTYNLVQCLQDLGARVEVARNDEIGLDGVEALRPRRIVLSPGPGAPGRAGVCPAVVRRWAGRVPILGVCLGHQIIARVFGGRVGPARRIVHGRASRIHHDGGGVFAGLPRPFAAMRYHSLAVSRRGWPACLQETARSDDGLVMGLRHRSHPVEGVQFHPESILTPQGRRLLANFLGL